MTGQDEREAHTEEQGENGIELSVDQQILHETRHTVYGSCRHGRLLGIAEKGPKGKLREIGQCYAHERKTTQEVEYLIALLLSGRPCHFVHHGLLFAAKIAHLPLKTSPHCRKRPLFIAMGQNVSALIGHDGKPIRTWAEDNTG
jgi:hypothetical protein